VEILKSNVFFIFLPVSTMSRTGGIFEI